MKHAFLKFFSFLKVLALRVVRLLLRRSEELIVDSSNSDTTVSEDKNSIEKHSSTKSVNSSLKEKEDISNDRNSKRSS